MLSLGKEVDQLANLVKAYGEKEELGNVDEVSDVSASLRS